VKDRFEHFTGGISRRQFAGGSLPAAVCRRLGRHLLPESQPLFAMPINMTTMRRLILVIAILAQPVQSALADGIYIPQRAVPKIPEIPAQRAALAWKDGTETLLISSSLDSPSQSLGWIIPLPAVPSEIEKTTPGALKTLDFCIQPRITFDLSRELIEAIVVCFVVCLAIGTLLFRRQEFTKVMIIYMILIIYGGIMLPAIGSSGSSSANTAGKIIVESSTMVGSYDIKILRAEKTGDLQSWLDENEFAALPPAAEKTITDYISQGWVFAAIRLTRAESGLGSPHPIKLVFKSLEPVYPMRLTALAGGSPKLEIFVFADSRATCNLLEMEFCDRFSKKQLSNTSDTERPAYFEGDNTDLKIGHAALCEMMWNGCVLTKLSGDVTAESMTDDIRLRWQPFSAYQHHYYTSKGAWQIVWTVFIWMSGAWLLITMILWRKRIRQSGGTRSYLTRVLLPPIAVFALCGWILHANLPRIDDADVHIIRYSPGYWYRLVGDLEGHIKNNPEILQKSELEIGEYLSSCVNKTNITDDIKPNRLSGGKILVEDSPGNFTVEKQGRELLISVYYASGDATKLKVTEEGIINSDKATQPTRKD
jgi:hypothetical protein